MLFRSEFADEVDTVNALIPEIRAQGVETIVVILHEGGSTSPPFNGCVKPTGAGFDIARKLDPAVDVVVTGHSHASYVCDIDGKIVTSAASNGRLITGVLLAVDERTGPRLPQGGQSCRHTKCRTRRGPGCPARALRQGCGTFGEPRDGNDRR